MLRISHKSIGLYQALASDHGPPAMVLVQAKTISPAVAGAVTLSNSLYHLPSARFCAGIDSSFPTLFSYWTRGYKVQSCAVF